MISLMRQFQQAGVSELAIQFAKFIGRLEDDNRQDVAIAAALVSEAVQQGHVCLDLAKAWTLFPDWAEWIPQNISDWMAVLRHSKLVGEAGEFKPLILSADGQLYLYRYWQDEGTVARLIQARCKPVEADLDLLTSGFEAWPSSADGVDWQKVAVLMAVTRQFSVISGGPGTGKTTVVAQLLQFLQQQSADIRISLAAPTGKAAARMQQAIEGKGVENIIEAKTIHRLLGITAMREQGKYHADNPLPLDVLVIDEASMIDISLMARILTVLPASARLILLGDSRQLASVESGAVLDNLCRGEVGLSAGFVSTLQQVAGISLSASKSVDMPLMDSIVVLQHSYRFASESIVGRLAKMTLVGDADATIALLRDNKDCWHATQDEAEIEQAIVAGYQPYIEAVMDQATPEACLAAFERYRMLCALRKGPQSVAAANAILTQTLRRLGWQTNAQFYHGQAIMITQNNYQLQLFNGDTGLVLPHPDSGELQACFISQNGVKWVLPIRLPAYETAFAMTVHKAQGAEFDQVDILLPEQSSPLLSRELLYTALTRARNKVRLLASEATIRHTIATKHQRESGLGKRLSNKRA